MKLLVGIMFAVGLLAPILYAVNTLSRMQNKRVYPLIRLQGADGRSFALAAKETSRTQQAAAKTRGTVGDTGSTKRRIA